MIADAIDGLPALAASGPVTLVSDSVLVRSAVEALAARHPVRALERANGLNAMAAAEAVVVDGRRAADLRLAGEVGRLGSPAVAVRRAERLSPLALRAFGLHEVDRDPSGAAVLATPVAAD